MAAVLEGIDLSSCPPAPPVLPARAATRLKLSSISHVRLKIRCHIDGRRAYEWHDDSRSRHPTPRRPRVRPPAHPRVAGDACASRPTSTKSSSTSSNSSSASSTARSPRSSTPTSSCSSRARSSKPAESRPRPRPSPSPTQHPRRAKPPVQGPRPQALAGEPAPQAGRARRPARTAALPRLRRDPSVCIGEEVREQLEYVPASLIVLQHVRPKYACQACQANVVIAERLPEPIEKGLPGPGLLAHVAVSKYADHLPLYRQEGIFKRFGVELSRSTMCDWMAAVAGLLAPIVKAMLKRVLLSEVVQTDDTTGPGAGPRRQGDQDRPALGPHRRPRTTASSFMTTRPTAAAPAPSGSSRASRATSRPTPIRPTTPCSRTARSSRSAAGCTRGGSSTRRGPATRRGRT